MASLIKITSIIIVMIASSVANSYGEYDDSSIVLTCSYTFSGNSKTLTNNSRFKINVTDETAISEIGTNFSLRVNDTMFKLLKNSINNNVVININRMNGKLDGFWIINEKEYVMSGECKNKSINADARMVTSNKRYIPE